MSSPPTPIPAALACQLPSVKRSNITSSKTTTHSKPSSVPRPSFNTQISTSTYTSHNTDLEKVSFDSMNDDSISYTAPPQTDKWGWANATNINGVLHITGLDGCLISRKKLVGGVVCLSRVSSSKLRLCSSPRRPSLILSASRPRLQLVQASTPTSRGSQQHGSRLAIQSSLPPSWGQNV
ncbi:hypothetical protein FRC08_010042 [Ceratobasidium sp. 394]|nr:hypothetical protein FRC08_010042 [Ceratobasidium sp. 394]KAG9079571.1 hypothetical protein FS749_008410 [Ceratobasidium sp. UAMH 11750]